MNLATRTSDENEGRRARRRRELHQSILETAGVTVECHSAKVPMTLSQESVLALVLREAVTNVVRHAQAKKCRLQLQEVN